MSHGTGYFGLPCFILLDKYLMVSNWSTKELKTGPIEQYIPTNNDVFSACCRCPPHTELPQQWRFREINASNDEYCRPSSVFDSFMMRRCYGICFLWPQGNIRWVYTPLINLEIAYDNLEFQVVVGFQVVVQHIQVPQEEHHQGNKQGTNWLHKRHPPSWPRRRQP